MLGVKQLDLQAWSFVRPRLCNVYLGVIVTKRPRRRNLDEPRTVLGRNIRICLDFIPWTMRDLAEQSRVPTRTLSAWNNVRSRKPNLSYLDRVSKALSCAAGL